MGTAMNPPSVQEAGHTPLLWGMATAPLGGRGTGGPWWPEKVPWQLRRFFTNHI